ncbi:site-specific DNA-methyltransferase [Brucella sp. TWI432]
MTISLLDGRVEIIVDDVMAALARLPSDSVDCVVTSPPYWGLRSYIDDSDPLKPLEIGLEPTLASHLETMVAVFDQVRRVLKPTGTCWINYGDCYATTPNGKSAADYKAEGSDDRTFRDKPFSTIGNGIKPKDLLMIPNRLAIALQDAGWWVRSEIIWGKSNPMPDSSGAYRPSSAHEKIFMLTKSDNGDIWRARDTGEISFSPDLTERCPFITDPSREGARWIRMGAYYDADAVCQAASPSTNARVSQDVINQVGSFRANGNAKSNGPMKAVVRGGKKEAASGSGIKNNTSFNDAMIVPPVRRYLRNYEPAPLDVWPISTQPFSDAHFATFPPELARRCILAGSPKGGLILDPFGGAGTTGLVAARHGREAILIELNPEYAALAKRRIEKEWRVIADAPSSTTDHGPLFSTEVLG